MKRTNIFLADPQCELIAIESKRRGLTKSEVIRRAVDNYIQPDESCINASGSIDTIALASLLERKGLVPTKAHLAANVIADMLMRSRLKHLN